MEVEAPGSDSDESTEIVDNNDLIVEMFSDSESDESVGIVLDNVPENVGVQVMNLHRIMPGIDRFYICRQVNCTPAGSFFGLITDWISSGVRFACPACGAPYNRNLVKTGLIPTNHIWHCEATGELMLAEWPETLEENLLRETALACAQHSANIRFTECSKEEIQLKFREVVATHGMKFSKMKLSPTVISLIQSLNASRGKKQTLFSWDHIKDGYTGAFYKYTRGETPVMKSSDVKVLLAMVYCLMRAHA